jgi:hypothetical protein
MPSLMVDVTEPRGAVVWILLRPGQTQADALRAQGLGVPAAVQLEGFLDSGANKTAVERSVLYGKGYKPANGATFSTPAGVRHSHRYEMDLALIVPNGTGPLDWWPLTVFEADVAYSGCNVLLARDFLANLLMEYDGRNSKVTLRW